MALVAKERDPEGQAGSTTLAADLEGGDDPEDRSEGQPLMSLL
jgi:hypothetical protein